MNLHLRLIPAAKAATAARPAFSLAPTSDKEFFAELENEHPQTAGLLTVDKDESLNPGPAPRVLREGR